MCVCVCVCVWCVYRANREDLTRAAQQLEQDRLVVSNKARRLQEDLKVAQEVSREGRGKGGG